MNITRWALENRTTVTVTSILVILCGIFAYFKLGKLKNPAFVIQTAVVVTEYPGASPREVELQVTEVIEKAVQKMGSLDHVRSVSERGLSTVFVDIQPAYPAEAMPQIWNDLRERIRDAKHELPRGAESFVIDHFGQTYGVFLALLGDGFSYDELRRYAEYMQKRLKLCTDVAQVELFGIQQEEVVIELSRERMAELEVNPDTVLFALNEQNMMLPFGHVHSGDYRVQVAPTGNFRDVEDIEQLVIPGGTSDPLARFGNAAVAERSLEEIMERGAGAASNQLVRLGDIAEVKRAYVQPPEVMLRFNGRPAIGIGVSTVAHGNAVKMGQAVLARVDEMMAEMPAGLEVDIINYQAKNVMKSIYGFIAALVEAIVIVMVVLTIALGVRSAVVIANGLLFNICATLIVMLFMDLDLQIMTISALIIVLGMLVDDSVVVVDNIKVRLGEGALSPEAACTEAAGATAWPQLIATAIIIISVLPIKIVKTTAGDFDRTLFDVIAIALIFSWIQAMTAVPVLGRRLLKPPREKGPRDYSASRFYRVYEGILQVSLRHRWLTLCLLGLLLLVACGGFMTIPQEYYPMAHRAQFQVNYWLPEGTRIERTSRDLAQLEDEILSWPDVVSVATSVGSGPLRFLLSFQPEQPNSCYGMMIVNTKKAGDVPAMVARTRKYIAEHFPDAQPRVSKLSMTLPKPHMVEARFAGEDPDVLRVLSEKAKAVMEGHPDAIDVHDDWRQRVPVWEPEYVQAAGALNAVGRNDLADTMLALNVGVPLGQYRERNRLLPIVVRMPAANRRDHRDLDNEPVWGMGPRSLPLGAIVSNPGLRMRDAVIKRRDRIPTISVRCFPGPGTTSMTMWSEIAKDVEAIPLPPGYTLEWGGAYEFQNLSNAGLAATYPVAYGLMFLAVLLLFNSIRRTIIVFLALPLCIIGVTIGLLVARMPFGVMAISGIIALIGIMVRGKLILITEMDKLIEEGMDRYQAIVRGAVTRVRPVLVTTFCTTFGMIPLVPDNLFGPMAVSIIGGLLFATFLTLVLIPVLYSLFFRIKPPPRDVAT